MTRALTVCAVVVSLFSTATLSAASIDRVRADRANERIVEAAEQRSRVRIDGLPLGNAALDTIELEPMKVWADDAKIYVHREAGLVETMAVPDVKYFRGKVAGDERSLVFLSVNHGTVDGLIVTGQDKRFRVGTGRERGTNRSQASDPLLISEVDEDSEAVQPENKWTCAVENKGLTFDTFVPSTTSTSSVVAAEANVINSAATGFSATIAVDTDFELYTGFGSNATSVTNYVGNLIGATSAIYVRDIKTTLLLGTLNVRTTVSDPWTVTTAATTSDALAEFGTYYHNNYPLGTNPRSAAVLLSGKAFFGGVAWTGTIGDPDFFCGVAGASCGDPIFANKYAGSYAFVGSLNAVETSLPNANATVNGKLYGIPASGSGQPFWMLLAFAHELGHSVAASHTSCYTVTAQERADAGVLDGRGYIDLCLSGEGGCYGGATSAPSEYGTIMSYCHNINRQSRYTFGITGELSAKMLPVLIGGMDENTGGTEADNATSSVGTITMASNLTCAAGQTASVTPCVNNVGPVVRNCTYAWQITGGTIQGSTTGTSISFTPNAASVTVTVTVTNTNLMTMTNAKTSTASCAAVTAPVTTTASATTATNVLVSWSAVANATSYQIHRSSNGATFGLVGTSVTTTFNDPTAVANTAYLYKVCAVNGSVGPFGPNDVATTVIFTDDPLSTGTTIKGAHITQLRTAITAVRTLASLSVPSYTDPTITTAIPLKAAHITELRSNLTAARAALGLSALPAFTDPTVSAGATAPKAVHFTELRNGVK